MKRQRHLLLVAVIVLSLALPVVSFAQSETITIDTSVLFTSVNDWITTFLPIAAIGLGIAIALSVIAYVGNAILQGFRTRR